jgi:CO/xanthine dehydrogenase Mo-binding subunit
VKLNPDGTVILTISAHENGQGSNVVMRKICAQSLEIIEESITLVETDTFISHYDNGSYASRETWVCGRAVLKACSSIKEKLMAEAADAWACPAEELAYSRGIVIKKGDNSPGISLSDLVRRAQTTYPFKELAVIESAASPYDAGAYFANFAAVEVDTATGEVKVEEFLAVHDSGTIINPVMLEGQVEGGLHMGLGYALKETYRIDPENGEILTSSFKNYGFLRAYEMPVIKSYFLNKEEQEGPFGAKSIGEATTVAVAPAVINAITHATGLEFNELPVTAEIIRMRLSGCLPENQE